MYLGSANLQEATVSQRCAVFFFRHTNLRTTGIRKAARGIDVLPCATKP
jgi:hypothetical protein